MSLAAVAFYFIWVCNQEAVILPETVRGTLYTIQTEFTFFTSELLWLLGGLAVLGPALRRVNPAVGEDKPVVYSYLCFLSNIRGEFGKKAMIRIGV